MDIGRKTSSLHNGSEHMVSATIIIKSDVHCVSLKMKLPNSVRSKLSFVILPPLERALNFHQKHAIFSTTTWAVVAFLYYSCNGYKCHDLLTYFSILLHEFPEVKTIQICHSLVVLFSLEQCAPFAVENSMLLICVNLFIRTMMIGQQW